MLDSRLVGGEVVMGDKEGFVQPQSQVVPSVLFLSPSFPSRIGRERRSIVDGNGPYQKSPKLYDKVTSVSPWLALYPMEVISLGLVSQNKRESCEPQWETG